MKLIRISCLVLPLVLASCKSPAPEVTDEVQKKWEAAKSKISSLAPEAEALQEKAGGELDKLFVFEYRVEEIQRNASKDEMEEILGRLGKERWDCFHIQPEGDALRLFCKRNPKTYLKYIPRIF